MDVCRESCYPVGRRLNATVLVFAWLRYVIYVKEGVYHESPTVTKKMVNVTMYGDGSRRSIVTGSKNFVDGTRTFQTATFGNN